MRIHHFAAALVVLTLAMSLSACGNKGDLVKPTSPDAQPPSAQKSATVPAGDAAPKPGQNAGEH